MTPEQVIELAKQAGIYTCNVLEGDGFERALETYTRLVREAYRAELLAGSGEPELPQGKYGYRVASVDYYTADQLAAAVLRARNQALEALEIARDHIDMAALEISHNKDAEIIRATILNMKDNT